VLEIIFKLVWTLFLVNLSQPAAIDQNPPPGTMPPNLWCPRQSPKMRFFVLSCLRQKCKILVESTLSPLLIVKANFGFNVWRGGCIGLAPNWTAKHIIPKGACERVLIKKHNGVNWKTCDSKREACTCIIGTRINWERDLLLRAHGEDPPVRARDVANNPSSTDSRDDNGRNNDDKAVQPAQMDMCRQFVGVGRVFNLLDSKSESNDETVTLRRRHPSEWITIAEDEVSSPLHRARLNWRLKWIPQNKQLRHMCRRQCWCEIGSCQKWQWQRNRHQNDCHSLCVVFSALNVESQMLNVKCWTQQTKNCTLVEHLTNLIS